MLRSHLNQASCDFPSCMFYAEQMKAFPDAKVILTVRDPAKWHKSASDTIYSMSKDWSIKVLKSVLPLMGQLTKLTHFIWNVNPFHGDFEDKDKAIQHFNAHVEQVKATVPADKLLIFEVSQGWDPLCKFLGVPGKTKKMHTSHVLYTCIQCRTSRSRMSMTRLSSAPAL